jgi:hypothetical protein
MARGQSSSPQSDPLLERAFIERERNRFAGRALSLLVMLNGGAALILVAVMAQARESSLDPKLAAAMMFFSGGAVAALFSSFLAYVNRTMRMESPSRANLRRVLRGLAIAAVIGSGAAFLVGMNMVGTVSTEKSSSHPKGRRENKPAASGPSEKVDGTGDGSRERAPDVRKA